MPTDSTDLHNLLFVIHVKVKRRNDTGESQNEVKSKRGEASAGTEHDIEQFGCTT